MFLMLLCLLSKAGGNLAELPEQSEDKGNTQIQLNQNKSQIYCVTLYNGGRILLMFVEVNMSFHRTE